MLVTDCMRAVTLLLTVLTMKMRVKKTTANKMYKKWR